MDNQQSTIDEGYISQSSSKIKRNKHESVTPLSVIFRTIISLLIIIPILLYLAIKKLFKASKSLQRKICLVTGAGRGLGRELCLKLAKQGAEIVCVDIREEANLETVKLIKDSGGKAHGYTCNVAKYEEVIKLAETVQRDVGRVYMLINNAALIMSHNSGEWPPEEVISMYNVNVISHYWTIQAFLPAMKEVNEGHIVSILSAASFAATPRLSVYSATKAAAESMLNAVRLELNINNEKNKIIITGVHPSFINTTKECTAMFDCGILGVLNVENVANTIIKGITYNNPFIVIPSYIHLLMSLYNRAPEILKINFYKSLNINIKVPTNEYKENIPFRDISTKCTDIGQLK